MLDKNKLIILFFILFFSLNVFAQNKKFTILNLYSDESTFKNVQTINNILVKELNRKNYKIYNEYVYKNELNKNLGFKTLFDFYKNKYKSIKFDLILSSGDNSYEFLNKYKKTLFSDTKVILGDIDSNTNFKNIQLEFFTIIKEEKSIQNLLNYISDKKDYSKEIYILSDDSILSNKKINEIKNEILDNKSFNFHFLNNTNEKDINNLDINSNIIIYSLNINDKDKFLKNILMNRKNIYSLNEDLSKYNNIISFVHSDILLGNTYTLIIKALNKGLTFDKEFLHYDLRSFIFNKNHFNKRVKNQSFFDKNLEKLYSLYLDNKLLFSFIFLLFSFLLILFVSMFTKILNVKNKNKEINILNYEIEENERKIISLTDNLPGLVYRSKNIFYKDIEYLSKGIFDLTGYTKEQITNQNPSFEDLILDEYKIEHKNKIENAILSQSTYYIKYEIRTFENKIISVFEKGHAIYNSLGELLAIEGYISDITELTIAQHKIIKLNVNLEHTVYDRTVELEETNKELQRLIADLQNTHTQLLQSEKMASLGSLVAGVAHEVNTPIGLALMGTTHFLEITNKINNLYKERRLEEEDFEEYLSTSLEVANSINFSIEKSVELIKSFKQIAVDQSSDEIRTFNIKMYLEEILLSIRNQTKKTKHHINIICEDNILIKTYPGAISQIITNLVMNSIIHAFSNDEEGEILIKIEFLGKRLNLSFRDNGNGIEDKNIKKIFDPFFTTKRDEGGSGLGLNVLYNLITSKLKGKIECNSKVHYGTEFKISFLTE